ncbi:hypothetical protein ACFVOB_14950 [Streptomyces rochei]|uniref:hypothetical protein n=1 Tax=Streptomyces rochei TaxID=1928 RepID=UPI0036932AD1
MAIEVISDEDGDYTERIPDTAPATEPDGMTASEADEEGYSAEPPFPAVPDWHDPDFDVILEPRSW